MSNVSDTQVCETSKYLVLGNVDAGKSSFIGVMEKNVLDDGDGYARSLITNLKHEKDSGRTSSHSFHYMVNGREITTLIDLCGHEKYLKTTIFGVTGLFGDYGIVIIGANRGICKMTIEHIGILISSKIPFIIIISKLDIASDVVMMNVRKKLDQLSRANKKKIIYFDKEESCNNGTYMKDIHYNIINSFQEGCIESIPVIMISNKTGYNIDFTRELITSIKSPSYLEKIGINNSTNNNNCDRVDYPTVMYIDNLYIVNGIGIVLSGTVKFGELRLGQKVYLGPISGKYVGVTIKSMHNCIREPVTFISKDESGSIAIRLDVKKSYSRKIFSKGHIVTPDLNFAMNNTCYDFHSHISIYYHSTNICNNFQTVIHCGTVRQVGCFKLGDGVTLQSNSQADVDIRFMLHPEFILPNTKFLFRDGRTKGIGRIIATTPTNRRIQNNNNA